MLSTSYWGPGETPSSELIYPALRRPRRLSGWGGLDPPPIVSCPVRSPLGIEGRWRMPERGGSPLSSLARPQPYGDFQKASGLRNHLKVEGLNFDQTRERSGYEPLTASPATA